MTERHALLTAIRNNPDEDLPRLAFADWLDEHGESERAELVRDEVWRSRRAMAHLGAGELNDPLFPKEMFQTVVVDRGIMTLCETSWEHWRSHGDLIWERELPWKVRLTTRLTLTAGGDIEFVGTTSKTFRYRVAGRVVAVKRHTERPAHGWGPWKAYVLSARWPGIEFELPPVRSLADVAAGRDEFGPAEGL